MAAYLNIKSSDLISKVLLSLSVVSTFSVVRHSLVELYHSVHILQ